MTKVILRQIRFILFFILCLTSIPCSAQSHYVFRHLPFKECLSNNYVNSIIKDKYGFVWFGTRNGLYKYDGYYCKQYNDANKDISDVESIMEDRAGHLYIKGGDKYFIYDYQKDCIDDESKVTETLRSLRVPNCKLQKIFVDLDKNLWLYTDRGIYYYSFSASKIKVFIKTKNLLKEPVQEVFCRGDIASIIYQSGKIQLVNIAQRIIYPPINYLSYKQNKASGYHIYIDADYNFWIYNDEPSGLWRYRWRANEWKHFGTAEIAPYKLSDDMINAVIDDGKGSIWIATEYEGIAIYNKHNNSIINEQHGYFLPQSIPNNNISTFYMDNNVLWIGLIKSGILLYDYDSPQFLTRHLPERDDINCIFNDREGNIWFGKDGGGLNKWNIRSNQIESITSYTNHAKDNVITCGFQDRSGRVWFGTYMNGLFYYENNSCHYFQIDKSIKTPSINNTIWDLDEDMYGNIWIGTLNQGLKYYNPKSKLTTNYRLYDKNTPLLTIRDIYCNGGSVLYIATYLGAYQLEISTKTFSRLNYSKSKTSASTSCIFKDSRGLIWIGGEKGLTVIDRYDDENYYLDQDNILICNTIKGITEDKYKNIWVVTTKGLNKIAVRRLHNKYIFQNNYFTEEDGLQDNDYGIKGICKTPDGKIIVGGIYGFNVIDPALIKRPKIKPTIVFTGLKVHNTDVAVDSVYNGHKILDTNIQLTKKIVLNYNENIFTLEFSALNYSVYSHKVRYLYKLNEKQTDWVLLADNKINFRSISPGTYRLLVKAVSDEGISSDPIALTLQVSPPFFESTVALIFYILVICTIIVAIYRNKRKREEAQLNIERMQMEIKQEHELDEMRLKVYTNISHDFKTPLSLILIPLDRLIDETHNPVLLKTLKIMQRNAKQLLELINQLLDFRKLDAGGEQLKLSKDDIVSFIDEVCYGFKELASNKDIKFEIHKEERKLVMLFDKDKVRKIMINLLSNAFKFTPNGGEVSIGIKTVTNNDHADCVQIYVADSGIGIPDEDKTRIFERFFQVDSPQDSSKTGNGIGLHIVKEYTKLMKGSIEVQDRVPKGSVFTITLPVVNETSEDIVEQSVTDKEKKEAIAAYDEVVKENQKSTLMLVEDNDDFRSFLIDCLKDEYNLFEASQGKEALAILRENRVDMVISDIMMPVMDGIELCNRIKSDPSISHIPVILLTARSAEEHIKEGLREGADDYITKPFNLDILKLRIKKILDWYKNNHEKFKIVNLAPSEITVSSVDEEFIRQAINTVEDNMDNSEFSVNDLAESVAMSRAQIYRKLPVITGQSPSDFIKLIRLKRAMQLLRSTSMNISEISYKVGLSSPKMLTKYFREEYGISPSEYRRNGDSSFTTVH